MATTNLVFNANRYQNLAKKNGYKEYPFFLYSAISRQVVLELQEEVVVFRQVVEALHRVAVVAYRQVVGAAFHLLAEAVALHRVVVVALHHREEEAYRQGGVAACHQLAEAVALHRVAEEALHHREVVA